MASTQMFDACPAFPQDVPIADLPKISLHKLTAGDQAEASRVFHACRAKGFFFLDLQNDPAGDKLQQDFEKLFAITKGVMDLTLEEKARFRENIPSDRMGYKAAGVMTNEKGQPDRCEFYNVGQDDIWGVVPPRAKPKFLQDKRETFNTFLENASPILFLIFSILETQLGLSEGTIAALHRRDVPSGSVIRMMRYPPGFSKDNGSSLISHTDYGSITMLCNILGGLQILPPGASNDESNWQYVKPEPNCVIINLGDALVEWTGDILRSNQHRVIAAPGAQREHTRYSIAYLMRPGRKVPMKRLVGGYIPTAAEDGMEEQSVNAEEWELKKTTTLRAGADWPRSRGGRELKIPSVMAN